MSQVNFLKLALKRSLFVAVLYCITGAHSLKAQQLATEVSASAAEEGKITSDLILSWTIGESSVETYSDGNILVVEGVHQPQIKITSLQKSTEENQVSVFPNPTVDVINISLKGTASATGSFATPQKTKAELHDLSGRLVYQAEFEGDTHKIDAHLLANGAYILYLTTVEQGMLIGSFKIEKLK